MAEKDNKNVVMPDAKLQSVSENAEVAEDFSSQIKKKTFLEKIKSYFKPDELGQEMMRYRANKPSQYLTFFALACVVTSFSTIYGYIKTVDWFTGIDILVAIVVILASFMASEELKDYNYKWSYYTFVIAAVSLIRIIYPIYTHAQLNNAGEPVLESVRFSVALIFDIIAAVSYALAGAIGLIRSKALKEYLDKHGRTEGDQL